MWGGGSGTKRFMGKTKYKRRKFATVYAVRFIEMSNIVMNYVKLGTERRRVITLTLGLLMSYIYIYIYIYI